RIVFFGIRHHIEYLTRDFMEAFAVLIVSHYPDIIANILGLVQIERQQDFYRLRQAIHTGGFTDHYRLIVFPILVVRLCIDSCPDRFGYLDYAIFIALVFSGFESGSYFKGILRSRFPPVPAHKYAILVLLIVLGPGERRRRSMRNRGVVQ